jgi:26S proteasome regulatory subunit N2
VTCHSAPSQFAYPKPEEKKEGPAKPVATAVLSTTARVKAREARKEARKLVGGGGSPSGKGASAAKSGAGAGAGAAAGEGEGLEAPALERVTSYLSTTSYLSLDEPKEKEEAKQTKKEKEPSSFSLANPSRLTIAQAPKVTLQEGQRYLPVSSKRALTGIVMLTDRYPDLPEEVTKVGRVGLGGPEEEEAEAPAPFEWNPSEPAE